MPPRTPSRGRGGAPSWLVAGLAALAVAEAVAIAGLIYTRPNDLVVEVRPPSREVADGARLTATPPAQIADTPARPVDAASVLAPKAGAVDGSPVAGSAAPDAAADRATRLADRFGGIRLSSPIELQVFEAGKLIGSTAGPIAMAEGPHTFEVVNDTLGYRARETASVRAGQMTALAISVPSGRISINAAPWADVVIDGNPAGQTPLANLSIPIGQHEIVFRHPQLGEQRQTAVVKSEGLTRVSANLQR